MKEPRSIEELIEIINGYELRMTWEECKVITLHSLAEARKYFKTEGAKWSERYRDSVLSSLRRKDSNPIDLRDIKTISYPQSNPDSLTALKADIRSGWLVREVLSLQDFVPPTDCLYCAHGKTRDRDSDLNLKRLWRMMTAEAHWLLGAVASYGWKGNGVSFDHGIINFGNNDELLNMTMNELRRYLPPELVKMQMQMLANAMTPPPPKAHKQVSMKQAEEILKRLNVPRSRKTIQRWERGESTPEGYTPERRDSLEAFMAWAKVYANREQARINANNALRIDNPASRKMGRFK